MIDLWFALADGGRLHVWQTNTTSQIKSIPLGAPVELASGPWSEVTVDWDGGNLMQLARHFDDGVTVTIDAPVDSVDIASLREVASSMA